MKISEQRIKAMVIMNIIDNCKMELDNTGQERYSLNEVQFAKVVDTLVKNIKVIQCCIGEAEPLACDCDRQPIRYNEFGICKYCGRQKPTEG